MTPHRIRDIVGWDRTPETWPRVIMCRVSGGRVLHAWQGTARTRCRRLYALDAEILDESDPSARCRACFPEVSRG